MHKAGDGWLVTKHKKVASDVPVTLPEWKDRLYLGISGSLLLACGQATCLHLTAQSGEDFCHLLLVSSLQLDVFFGPLYQWP